MKYLKVFTDFAEIIDPLQDAEVGRLFKSMLSYAESGTAPDLRGNERFVWNTAKQIIDREAAYCEKQAENGRKGGRPKNPEKPSESQINPEKPSESQINPEKPSESQINPEKPSESLKDKDKDKEYKETLPIGSAKKAAPAFHPPTVEEVKAYCRERNNSVDAVRFVDYYTANGWKVGKNPMKDWRAAVRTWEREDRPSGTARKNNTLLNYKETGKSHATLTDIGMDISEL